MEMMKLDIFSKITFAYVQLVDDIKSKIFRALFWRLTFVNRGLAYVTSLDTDFIF